MKTSLPAAPAEPEAGEPRVVPLRSHRPERYLQPGELVASAAPLAVTTILGTCVSVCLWDPVEHVGGINHFLLPYRVGGAVNPNRFGALAIPRLFQELQALGAQRSRLRAKVFGGMCSCNAFPSPTRDLGSENVELALKLLHEEQVRVFAQDVGGSRGRKLIFQVDDGEAWVKHL